MDTETCAKSAVEPESRFQVPAPTPVSPHKKFLARAPAPQAVEILRRT